MDCENQAHSTMMKHLPIDQLLLGPINLWSALIAVTNPVSLEGDIVVIVTHKNILACLRVSRKIV